MKNLLKIIQGDALAVLKTLPAESVQCCVTSPPYWRKRKYNVPALIWDGKEGCKHKWGKNIIERNRGSVGDKARVTNSRKERQGNKMDLGKYCLKCRAWKGILGLEPTPELYVSHIAQIFRELKRVLRKDGTLWLNLGDTYIGGGRTCQGEKQHTNKGTLDINSIKIKPTKKYKAKDIVGIPWRCAFALHDDGWYLRCDNIWSKPNPMPESVTDRPTISHEYVFLLTKSPKYYYDYDAIKEKTLQGDYRVRDRTNSKSSHTPGMNPHTKLNVNDYEYRNKRSVWEITVPQYKGDHFATFPPALVKPCILAGSKPSDTVIDVFSGSGTTGQVALELGRKYIGIELNPEYIKFHDRISQIGMGI